MVSVGLFAILVAGRKLHWLHAASDVYLHPVIRVFSLDLCSAAGQTAAPWLL